MQEISQIISDIVTDLKPFLSVKLASSSSCGLGALIFHVIEGLLCNLQAQHFSGQCLNYVPVGHSLIPAGSSRIAETG